MSTFQQLVNQYGLANDRSIGDLMFTVTNGNFVSWVGLLMENGEQLVVTQYNSSLAGEQPRVTSKIIVGGAAIQAAFDQFCVGTDLADLAWL